MDKFIHLLNDISPYVEILFFLVTTVFSFCIGRSSKKYKCKKVNRILGLKNTDTYEIMLPTWEGNIEYTHKDAPSFKRETGKTLPTYEYIQKAEVESILHIQTICNIAGIKAKPVLKSPLSTDLIATNNKFICGGPLSNIYLKHIFSGEDTSPFSFKRRFLFGCRSHWMNREANKQFREVQKEIY